MRKPKTAPQAQKKSTALVPVNVEHEGQTYELWREGAVLEAKDLDVGRWLGFGRPRNIRPLIKRYSDDLGEVSLHREAKPSTVGGRPEECFYLTEEQVLFLAAKAETPKATQVLKTMIAVFLAAQRGELPGQVTPEQLDQIAQRVRAEVLAELGQKLDRLEGLLLGPDEVEPDLDKIKQEAYEEARAELMEQRERSVAMRELSMKHFVLGLEEAALKVNQSLSAASKVLERIEALAGKGGGHA